MESGNSIAVTTFIVNQHRSDSTLPSFTMSAVYGCYKRMKPQIRSVQRAKQGNTDEKSAWARARARWMGQLLLAFCEIEYDDDLFKQFDNYDINNPPKCFNIAFLKKMSKFKTAFWDETHKKCTIGCAGSRIGPGKPNVSVHFPRDVDGNIDIVNGTYTTDVNSILSVKYEKEVRFCLGVFLKKNEAGNVTGERLPIFDYTEKRIIAIERRDKLRLLAMMHVKKVNRGSKTSVWVECSRVPGAIYRDDAVNVVKEIGKETHKRLKAEKICTVQNLKSMTDAESDILIAKGSLRVSKTKLEKFREDARKCLDEDSPVPIDHRNADNPYLSRFGDRWEIEIDRLAMAGKICITEMIDHIFEESRKALGEDYLVYHDALSLMTGSSAVNYMKRKGYYKHWILPQLDLMNDGTGELKSYANRPVGNSPEIMPLDCSLNAQLHRAVRQHIELTQIYTKEEHKALKFSMATPIAGVSAYHRVWSIHPTASNIKKDILKVFVSARTIFEKKGCIVPGLGNRPGRRHVSNGGGGHSNWGGRRTRTLDANDYGTINLHPDAHSALEEIRSIAQDKYNIKIEKSNP